MPKKPFIALRPDDSKTPSIMDDVVVSDVEMFRMEAMDEDCWWVGCYFANTDDRLTFSIYIEKGKIKVHVVEAPTHLDANYEHDGKKPPNWKKRRRKRKKRK